MTSLGIDLAWTYAHPSGFAVLEFDDNCENVNCISRGRATTDVELCDLVNNVHPDIIAVDAPLIIQNPTGSRRADRQLSDSFRQYDAGVYPANRNMAARYGNILRGEEIVNKLANEYRIPKKLIEVYPHAASVNIFNLNRIFKYKKGRVVTRREQLQQYQNRIIEIVNMENFDQQINDLSRVSLKEREDILDAIICAYTGAWYRANKPIIAYGHTEPEIVTRYEDFSTQKIDQGFIVVPFP